MEVDRPHFKKATRQHYAPGPDLEPPRKKEERKTEELVEEGPGSRHPADWLHLERVRKDGSGPGEVAGSG